MHFFPIDISNQQGNMPTQQQLNQLKKQKAFAWAKYYEKIVEAHDKDLAHYNTINKIREEVTELPTHLVD